MKNQKIAIYINIPRPSTIGVGGGYDFTENEFSLQLSPSKEKRGLWL